MEATPIDNEPADLCNKRLADSDPRYAGWRWCNEPGTCDTKLGWRCDRHAPDVVELVEHARITTTSPERCAHKWSGFGDVIECERCELQIQLGLEKPE